MGRLGFYFEMRNCIACKACQIACKDKNNLWEGQYFRRVVSFELGEGFANSTEGPLEENGSPRLGNFSAACNHCAKPACVPVCPTGALSRGADGIVLLDAAACIGCGKCARSCPYQAVSLKKAAIPAAGARSPHSGAIQSSRAQAAKCDACGDLRRKGKNPACVDACITHCLEFGDLEELKQKHGPHLVQQLPGLPDPARTEPSLLIKTARHE
jgi:anaerobic dimethyl sulfoxide reductase subunit B (iron-sulfur subunit)